MEAIGRWAGRVADGLLGFTAALLLLGAAANGYWTYFFLFLVLAVLWVGVDDGVRRFR